MQIKGENKNGLTNNADRTQKFASQQFASQQFASQKFGSQRFATQTTMGRIIEPNNRPTPMTRTNSQRTYRTDTTNLKLSEWSPTGDLSALDLDDSEYGCDELLSVVLKKHKHRLVAAGGSIVNFKGSAIVNAANTKGLGGGGIDGAVNRAGGYQLMEAREALPIINILTRERIPTGDARMTPAAGMLHCSIVIHAVGPKFSKQGTPGEDLHQDYQLAQAYTASLDIAQREGCKSIGFTLLSAGIFRGPRTLGNVINIGLEAIVDWCNKPDNDKGPMEIFLIAFTKDEQGVLETAMEDIIKKKIQKRNCCFG